MKSYFFCKKPNKPKDSARKLIFACLLEICVFICQGEIRINFMHFCKQIRMPLAMDTRPAASRSVPQRGSAWFRAGTGPTYRARVMMTVSLHKANSLKLYSIYYILYIIYYILYIIYYILHVTYYILHITYYILDIVYYSLYIIHYYIL